MDGVGDGSAAMASPLAALAERRAAAAASPLAAPVCNEPVGIVSVAEKSPLAWSADGKRLAAVAGGGAIYILAFDGSTFRMSKLLPSVGGRAIRALLWHVDNVTLVVAGMDGVVVWDVEAAVVTQVISHRTLKALGLPPTTPQVAGAHESDVESVCWAFDSTSLITGSKGACVCCGQVHSLVPHERARTRRHQREGVGHEQARVVVAPHGDNHGPQGAGPIRQIHRCHRPPRHRRPRRFHQDMGRVHAGAGLAGQAG